MGKREKEILSNLNLSNNFKIKYDPKIINKLRTINIEEAALLAGSEMLVFYENWDYAYLATSKKLPDSIRIGKIN